MRVLAIFSFSFAAAVFGANYAIAEAALAPAGAAAAVLGAAVWVFLKRRKRRRALVLFLVCAGLSAGFLWTRVYTQIFFLPAQALDGRTVLLTARVADWPKEERTGFSLPVRVDTASGVPVSAILYTDGQGADLRPGDRVSTVARCILGDRTFAGEKITYYTAKGIFLRAKAYGLLTAERPDQASVTLWPALLSRRIKAGIDAAFPPDAAPLIRALVTGNRDNLTDQFTTSLQRTGLSHMVAVSGMHLGFLTGILSTLLGRGKGRTAGILLIWVVFFCGVAGNTPSVLRAAVMLVLLHLAPLLGRERDDITALGAALLLLLIGNPFSAAHVGLQLSFAAVGGIFLVSGPIQTWMLARLHLEPCRKEKGLLRLRKIPRFLVTTLAATLGASVLTVPLVAFHFRMLSLIAPLSNLLTLWAAAGLFLGGLGLGLLGSILPVPARVLAAPFTLLARYLDGVVEVLGRLPLAAVPLNTFYYQMWTGFLCFIIAAMLLTKVRGRKRVLLPACAVTVTFLASLIFSALSFQMGEMTAVALDVGQGQSVLVRIGRFLVLADCGGDGPDDAGDVAAGYIQSTGRGRLDLLVVSHYHDDHANGVPQLLRRLDVSVVAVPDVEEDAPLRREILQAAQERGTEVWMIRADTLVDLGEGRTIRIFPPLGSGTDTNELGLTLLAGAGGQNVLITGDMTGEVEELLLEYAGLPQVELMVAGHHGSAGSNTQELLERVRPELAVISAGEGNPYGHPAQEALERLDAVGAELYRTDLHGTVSVRFWGERPS